MQLHVITYRKLHAITSIYMQLHAITCNYMQLYAITCCTCNHTLVLTFTLFDGLAIGHKTLAGVQQVYAWPFPKRLFRGKCTHQDFVFVRPHGSDHALFHPAPDNVWYCRCLLLFTIVVRTDVMGSVHINCALLSKLEPYCAPDPESDDWMAKAETCRLYELAPKPSLFVRPITAVLDRVPMVRAGNTGTIPYSMRGHDIILEGNVIPLRIRVMAADCGTSTRGR